MIQVFLLFCGKWTVVWRKKIYTDSQHNMQKNNIKITCQSLAHWVKSPKQASEIRVWTSSFWFKSHEMSNRLLHGFILHISTISHNIPVSTSYDIGQWPIHVLAFSHYECQIAGFFLLIQSIPVNLTHYTVYLSCHSQNTRWYKCCYHQTMSTFEHCIVITRPTFDYLSLHTGGSPLYPRFLRLSSCFSVIPYCSRFFSKFPRACTITLVVFFTAKLEINMSQKL